MLPLQYELLIYFSYVSERLRVTLKDFQNLLRVMRVSKRCPGTPSNFQNISESLRLYQRLLKTLIESLIVIHSLSGVHWFISEYLRGSGSSLKLSQ